MSALTRRAFPGVWQRAAAPRGKVVAVCLKIEHVLSSIFALAPAPATPLCDTPARAGVAMATASGLPVTSWCCCWKSLPSGNVGVIERCGKYARPAHEGCNFVCCCCCEAVGGTLSMRIQQLNVRIATVTKDAVYVNIVVAVQFHVIKERLPPVRETMSRGGGEAAAAAVAAAAARARGGGAPPDGGGWTRVNRISPTEESSLLARDAEEEEEEEEEKEEEKEEAAAAAEEEEETCCAL